jgi:hypothetical protein
VVDSDYVCDCIQLWSGNATAVTPQPPCRVVKASAADLFPTPPHPGSYPQTGHTPSMRMIPCGRSCGASLAGHQRKVGHRTARRDTHALRRTKASIIYKATGKLRAVQTCSATRRSGAQFATSALMSRTHSTSKACSLTGTGFRLRDRKLADPSCPAPILVVEAKFSAPKHYIAGPGKQLSAPDRHRLNRTGWRCPQSITSRLRRRKPASGISGARAQSGPRDPECSRVSVRLSGFARLEYWLSRCC